METTLKAVAIRAFGSPEGLAVVDLPDPSPADGQVLIATEAIGVGGVDGVIRSAAIAGPLVHRLRLGHGCLVGKNSVPMWEIAR
jgi:NADPH:quinone reductase-like Zn-dependent oxidoreductase